MLQNKSLKLPAVWILLCIAFILRISTFMGMAEGDDLYYTLLAHRFGNGDLSAGFIFDIRWAVFVPVALLYKIFGVNDLTSIAPTFFYGLASVYLVFRIVKEETSETAAVLTTLLYTTFPVVLIYGNFFQTDPALEFFSLLSIFMFQKAAATGKMRWFVFAGLALGAIFLTRVTGLFIAPLASFYILWKKGWTRQMITGIAVSAAFSLAIPAVQGIVYYFVHGNFFHYFEISRNVIYYQNSMNDVDPKDTFFYIRTLFKTEDFANWRMYGINGWVFCGMFLYFLYNFYKKNEGRETVFLIWYLSYFMFMSFAPTSISPYTTLIRNIRYSIVFTAPMCAFMALTLLKTASINSFFKYAAGIVFIVMLVSNVYFSIDRSESFKKRRNDQKSSIVNVLEKYPGETIYLADKNTGRRIAYYSGYTNKNYRHISSLSQIDSPGIFLLMGPGSYSVTRFYIPKKELAEIKKNPPEGLTLLEKLPYFNVYRADPSLLNN